MKALSIDIGIIHLAIIGAVINDFERSFVIKQEEITLCELINITNFKCLQNCQLYHDKNLCDYMSHVFVFYKTYFDSADVILVERQPPEGFIAIQELILREYRNKTILISPNAMLSHFGFLNKVYEERKLCTVKFAKDWLSNFPIFNLSDRQHDMADAFCILYYYLVGLRKEKDEERANELYKQNFKKIRIDFEKFRYNG